MIEVKSANKNFGELKVLRNINLNISKGDIFGIIGESGAGKSTLLRCLNGLETYESGSIKVSGKEIKDLLGEDIRNLRKDMGMIFQNFNLLNTRTVYENVALPLKIWKVDKKFVKKRVLELLDLVGLKSKIKNKPLELSGGQRQRVAIARALALEPKILLCDEATSALDPSTTESILKLIKEINEKLNITVVMVTHQMEVIKQICNKVALMESGEVKAFGTVKDLFLRPQGDLKNLLSSKEVLPTSGVNIKIYFPEKISEKSLITTMARKLNIDFSIVWGRLETFRGEVLGSLIINADCKYEEIIYGYLDENSICWEVV
ncbi:methionine ABC transporter ATP-binding protein [Haloimpatiens sp. FM7315]|uniref:methionine ABC transporter ATP-binding protein n=1 Tax=Haloimpatiens sp. FM7315 TaxID=3298609 RepID=UPI0035A3058D